MAKEDTPEAQQVKYQAVADSIKALYTDEFNHDTEDFEILSTIRYDPLLTDTIDSVIIFDGVSDTSKLFFLFDEHFHRINFSLDYFKFGYKITREQLLHKLNEALIGMDKSNSYKLRLTINKQGEAKITVTMVAQRYNLFDGFNTPGNYTSPIWNVYIDSHPIMISPFTSFKTTRRERYNEARERTLPKDNKEPQEVLLFNSANQVTEGSITNVAFEHKDPFTGEEYWVTPMLSSGCLCGVVRHMLLAKGLIRERQINLKDVKVGDPVLLFNGIIGVVKGQILQRPGL